jgi:hypothetical protein
LQFSPTFFGGKFSAEFFPKFSPEKNEQKIGPSKRMPNILTFTAMHSSKEKEEKKTFTAKLTQQNHSS